MNTSPFLHPTVGGAVPKPKAVVTGGRVGLGLQVAKQLLGSGFDVVITGRSAQGASQAAAELQNDFPNAKVLGLSLELGDFESVRDFVATNQTALTGWTHLINNAGAKIESPYKQTAQGHEWHFGVNHLAPHLLTHLLWQLQPPTEKRRVVMVASIVARIGKPELWGATGSGHGASEYYASSKLANLASMMMFNQRVNNLSVTAAHPGFSKAEPYGTKLTRFGENLLAQSAASGARPIARAAFEPTGSYWGPQGFELWGKPKRVQIPNSLQAKSVDELWVMSNEATGSMW